MTPQQQAQRQALIAAAKGAPKRSISKVAGDAQGRLDPGGVPLAPSWDWRQTNARLIGGGYGKTDSAQPPSERRRLAMPGTQRQSMKRNFRQYGDRAGGA